MTALISRRRATALFTSAVAASALAACGSHRSTSGSGSTAGSGSGEKTTIRFLYATGDETWNSVVEGVVDAFNAQSSTTVVKLDPLTAGADYATSLKTMDATGNWPAIVDMRDTLTYIKAGKLAGIPESVTSLLADDSYGAAEDGKVYTVPSSALNGEIGINIVYNKDYFSEHSLSVPTTYQEFIDLLDAIKANGDTPLATAATEVWPSDQLWKPLAAPTFAKYDEGFWNAVADGKATIEDLREPLTRLKTIIDDYVLEGWQSTADAQTTTLLVNGQAVMATSSAGLGRLNDIHKVAPDFNAGLFIIPADDGTINVLKNSVAGDTASGLAISAQAAANEAELASAVEFLEFYYSVDGCNLIESFGWVSPNIKKSDEVTRNDSIPGASDYYALLENPKLNWYTNDPKQSTFSAFNTFFRQTRIEMQDGQTTIDEAITKTQDEFDSSVKNA